MTYYFEIFLIFSFIGWFIDTADRSLVAKKYVARTVVPFVSPPYGFGSIAIILILKYVPQPAVVQIVLSTAIVTAIELISGLFCVNVLKRRLWDYSYSRFNLWGHIDLEHSFYWLIVSTIFYLLRGYLVK